MQCIDSIPNVSEGYIQYPFGKEGNLAKGNNREEVFVVFSA